MTLKAFFTKLASKVIWLNLLGMAVLVGAIAFGVWKGLEIYTRHGEAVNVPDVKRMPLNDAVYTLNRHGLQAEVVDSAYSRKQNPGTVLDQNKQAGAVVKPGRTIYLTLATRNAPLRTLPNISDNCSLREAEAKLKAVGFKLAPCEYIDGEADWVYRVKSGGHIVENGQRVDPEVPIVLVVGRGYDGGNELDELMSETNGFPDSISTEDASLEDFEL